MTREEKLWSEQPKPDEIVPEALREYLRWGPKHDAMAAKIMREFNLKLPRDRELVRQLTLVRVQQEKAK